MKRHDTDTNLDTEKVSRIKCVSAFSTLSESDLERLAWSTWPVQSVPTPLVLRVSVSRKEPTSTSRLPRSERRVIIFLSSNVGADVQCVGYLVARARIQRARQGQEVRRGFHALSRLRALLPLSPSSHN